MMTRSFIQRIALLSLAIVLAFAGRASAQTAGTGGSSAVTSITADDFTVRVENTPGVALRDFDLQRFFNIANCECNTPISLFFTLTASGFAKRATFPTGTIEFWVGYQCDQPLVRRCTQLGTVGASLTSFVSNGGLRIPTDSQTMSVNMGQPQIGTVTVDADGGLVSVDGGTSVNGCNIGTAFDQQVYILVTLTGDTPYDVISLTPVRIDMAAPPEPLNVEIKPGNEALIATWTAIDVTTLDDFLGYQVVCDRGGALQVFADGTFDSGFHTCPNIAIGDGVDSHVLGLDQKYVCSPLLSPTTNSFRVKILENDVIYGMSVVAIDTHYNASQPVVQYQAPVRTLSFYDKYRTGDSMVEPGRATGGFCAVATEPLARGRLGFGVLVACVALGLAALRGRKRRGRGRDDGDGGDGDQRS